jgi:hypothetical protein
MHEVQLALRDRPIACGDEVSSDEREIGETDIQADLLVRLADRLIQRLARAEMAANRCVEIPGPGVLRQRPPLKERERPVSTNPADPDVQRRMPVPIPMDLTTRFDATSWLPIGIEDIEEFVLGVGRWSGVGTRDSGYAYRTGCIAGVRCLTIPSPESRIPIPARHSLANSRASIS